MYTEELIESLAQHLGVDVNEIETSTWNPSLFIVGDQEYLVYETQEEAEEAAVEQMKDLLQIEGISFLDWDYMPGNMEDYVDMNWFEAAMRESNEQYVNDIREEWEDDDRTRLEHEMENAGCETEEEYVDKLCEDWSNGYEWYDKSFGDTDELFRERPELIDLDKVAQAVVDSDGIASVLAGYDGKEIELDNGGYAYRVN